MAQPKKKEGSGKKTEPMKCKSNDEQLMKEVAVHNPDFVKWIRSKSGKKE